MNPGKPFTTGLYIILFLIIPFMGFSQNDSSAVSARKTISDTVSKHSLYSGLGYGSNMVYLGSTISGNKPFEYASLVYGYNNELFAGFSAVHTSGIEPFVSSAIGYLNYSHTFNSWFDISTGLSGYKFNQRDDSLITGFVYGDLTLGFDWKILYTKISGGALFSDETNWYFQVKNSRFFQTPEIFKGKAYVSFDPYFNILFGNFEKSETIPGTYFTHPGRWMKKKRQRPSYTSYTESFGLIEIDFGIPVALNFDNFVIEAEPCYLLQTYESEFSPNGFVFLLSAFFKIF